MHYGQTGQTGQAGQTRLNTLATDFKPTGNLRLDMAHFLQLHGHAVTAGHCARVAGEAKRLAARFGADGTAAETAGYRHELLPALDRSLDHAVFVYLDFL